MTFRLKVIVIKYYSTGSPLCGKALTFKSTLSFVKFFFAGLKCRLMLYSRENQLPAEGLDPQDPRWSSPAEWEEKCCYSQKNWGSICCCLFSLQLTSHKRPFRKLFRIKCERYIFLKKCVRSSLLLIMFPHVYVYSCKGMTNEYTSLEKYTSHTLFERVCERVVCERWVGDWTDCNIFFLTLNLCTYAKLNSLK